MVKVTAFEASARFGELLERVAKGAEVVITRHDKPVARLIPEGATRLDDIRRSVQGLRDLQLRIRRRSKARQELLNLDGAAGELELKLNQQFGADDVRDVKTVLRFLQSAHDEAAFVRARRAVRTALERQAVLLEPFAKEAPASPGLLASRQRVSAMLAPFRR